MADWGIQLDPSTWGSGAGGLDYTLDTLPSDSGSIDWSNIFSGSSGGGSDPFSFDYGDLPGIDLGGSSGSSVWDSVARGLGGLFTRPDGSLDWSKLGLAGVAGTSALGALTGGPQSGTQSSTSSVNLPDWYTQASQGVVGAAQNLPGYSQFFSDDWYATAPMSDLERYVGQELLSGQGVTTQPDVNMLEAAQSAYDITGRYAPTLAAAAGYAEEGGKSVLDRDLGAYMSPYWEQALNPQRRLIQQENELMQNRIGADMAKKGMFGTSRFAVAEALAQQEANRRLDDLQSRGAQEAWQQALGMAQGDRGAAQQTAQTLQGLAGTESAMGTADINRLMETGQALTNVGTTQASQEQARLGALSNLGRTERDILNQDIAARFGEWGTVMGDPYKQLSAVSGALGNIQVPKSQTQTTTITGSSPNVLQTLAGTGASLWGLANPQGLS